MSRKSKGKKLKKKTMIFCEGETEKYYFEMLKKKYSSTNVVPIKSEVIDGKSWKLVKNAVDKIKAQKHKYEFEKIYVVYDKDSESLEDIEKALKIAKENGIITLYSNECFEYWILLHYKKSSQYNGRKTLYKLLEKEMQLDCAYESIKGERVAPYLTDKVHTAFDNANKIDMSKDINLNILQNPYTNIHLHIKDIFNTDKL